MQQYVVLQVVLKEKLSQSLRISSISRPQRDIVYILSPPHHPAVRA